MSSDRHLRILHTVSTAQFTASAALIIFWSLYQVGLNWWTVFSLSSQGIVIVVLGVLIYGFAVFYGAVGQRIEGEHPFTGSIYYRHFYVLVPIIGGFIIAADYWLYEGWVEGIRGFALGTVVNAYVIWLFIDPVAGVLETRLPESRRLRAERLGLERQARDLVRRQKAEMVERLRARRAERLARIEPLIEKNARRLADLLVESADDPRRGFGEAASIGLRMWQAGGMESMRRLYSAAAVACRDMGRAELSSCLDYWWDGVGDWRRGASA